MTGMRAFVTCLMVLLVAGCGRAPAKDAPLRLGYFPNITHAQALVGKTDGTFVRATGGKVELHAFNAGPAAMEALLGDSLDMSYVGGGPALTAYVRSEGRVHVLAGAASGGSALVVREGITDPAQLQGKRVSTPQLGNTQDIALRHFLHQRGMKDVALGEKGVQVLPMANSDALGQFRRGQLDGAWVPEPWASRIVHEGNGHVLIDERTLWPDGTYPTTVLVVTDRALREHPEQVEEVLKAHEELTARWKADPTAFAKATNEAFEKETGHALKPDVLADAFKTMRPELSPMAEPLKEIAEQAHALGYLPSADLSRMVVSPSRPVP